MTAEADACVPQALTDFVFDLYDNVANSQIAEEQSTLYGTTFKELCSKYFASSPWPSPTAIASECNGDPLFLALYREVTHRHWHSVGRPTIHDRIDGWHVYRELFDEILEDAEEKSTSKRAPLYILPAWTFDILHEFVYQFQGFCQFRHSLHNSATKHGVTVPTNPDDEQPTSSSAPHHVIENLTAVSQNRDAWAVENVVHYLNRLKNIGTSAKCTVPAYQYLGLFASVTLSRLECLIGDYHGCLDTLAPVTSNLTVIEDEGPKSAQDVVKDVFAARLSMAYHAGVSFLMLRRYKDAIRVLGEICSLPGFKTGQLRKEPQSGKNYDRMLALLAILTHVCPPGGLLEDSVVRTIRDQHGSQLSKIDAGEDGYEDLFMFACPKFVNPAMPDFTQATSTAAANSSNDAYKRQVRKFQEEMASQHTARKLRSYMKLYTSISLDKLAAFNDTASKDFLPLLLSYKHKMRQLEGKAFAGTDENASSLLDGKMGSALDIHYYIVNDMVHIDEAEKQRRFENFFMAQISQNTDICKDLEIMSTVV